MPLPVNIEQICAALGPGCPPDNVAANWPLVEAALGAQRVDSPMTSVAAIATIGVETGSFAPVKERGGPQYLNDLYDGRKDLGNTEPGDGARFRGRGFVQITGRWNYQHFGAEIGKDLVANPDLAMDPGVAAEIFAVFFRERGVRPFADAQRWDMVRRRVNGGMDGWPRFIDVIAKLRAALDEASPNVETP
ncbi:MAG: glycoside hydrolase family 19 protein [Candidatus Acidiferrales bacterium]